MAVPSCHHQDRLPSLGMGIKHHRKARSHRLVKPKPSALDDGLWGLTRTSRGKDLSPEVIRRHLGAGTSMAELDVPCEKCGAGVRAVCIRVSTGRAKHSHLPPTPGYLLPIEGVHEERKVLTRAVTELLCGLPAREHTG